MTGFKLMAEITCFINKSLWTKIQKDKKGITLKF